MISSHSLGGVLEPLAGPADPGIIDQHVETPKPRDRGLNNSPAICNDPEIAWRADSPLRTPSVTVTDFPTPRAL